MPLGHLGPWDGGDSVARLDQISSPIWQSQGCQIGLEIWSNLATLRGEYDLCWGASLLTLRALWMWSSDVCPITVD